VDLGSTQSVNSIIIHNRADCCQERLRDITVSILDAGGVEVEFQSEVQNPGKFLGSPAYLALNLADLAGKSVSGQIVRIARAPDPNAAGDDATLLSMGEVEVCAGDGPPPPLRFRRGDVDASGVIDITDAVDSLAYQFLGTFEPTCLDALDDDDNGSIEITDPIYSLSYQFGGGPPQPAPGPNTCGADPTADSGAPDGKDLGCRAYAAACNP